MPVHLNMPVIVSLVENNRELRASFAALLNGSSGLHLKSCYGTGEEALQRIPLEQPDVVLMDINLPGMGGIECVSKLKAKLPHLQVLVMTRFEQTDLVFDSIRAGATGYLLKNTPGTELIEAIEHIHAGGSSMTVQLARMVLNHIRQAGSSNRDPEKLTLNEQEVLVHRSKGNSYDEIGEALNISTAKVRSHLHSIYRKIHVPENTQTPTL